MDAPATVDVFSVWRGVSQQTPIHFESPAQLVAKRCRAAISIAELLADTEEAEYLIPGEVQILNAYEMEETAKARAQMAANPCIQFSNVPVQRVWRTTNSLTPSYKDWLLNR